MDKMKCRKSRRLMDRYLRGDLCEPLLEEYERHYIGCASCFAELRIREKLALKEIRIHAPERLKSGALKPALVFSSLFLIVGAALFMVRMQKIRFYDRLSRFDPPIFISSQLRNFQPSDSEIESAFARAMRFYNQKRYQDALDILQPLRPNLLPHPKLSFFTGICLLLEDHPTDSIVMFDSIIRTMDPAYFDEAIYFKGIALLRLRKKSEAVDQFRNLAGMISPISLQAREMIEKISDR
jgi:tetratricopeptide (TPR) repeat protein